MYPFVLHPLDRPFEFEMERSAMLLFLMTLYLTSVFDMIGRMYTTNDTFPWHKKSLYCMDSSVSTAGQTQTGVVGKYLWTTIIALKSVYDL
jgi:hypothetical protein